LIPVLLLSFFLQVGNSTSEDAQQILTKANHYRRSGQLDSAFLFYKRAVGIYESLNDSVGLAKAKNSFSTYFRLKGEFGKSEQLLLECVALNSQLGNKNDLVKNYLNLGNLFQGLHRNDLALQYFSRCIYFCKNETVERKKLWLAGSYNGKALVFLDTDTPKLVNNDSAYYYLKKAESLFVEMGDARNLFGVKKNLGVLAENKGLLDKAKMAYSSTLAYSRNSGNRLDETQALFNLGNVFFKQKLLDSAAYYFESSLKIAKEIGSAIDHKNASRRLVDIFFESQSYGRIASLFTDYDSLTLAIYNESLAEKIAETEGAFENQKLKTSIAENEKKTDRLRFGFILSLLTVFIIAILLAYVRQKQKLATQESQLAKTKVNDLLRQQEIRSLQGVLTGQEEERKRIAGDLHDKLGAILGMVKLHFSAVEERIDTLRDDNKQQYEKANDLLDQASEEVRNISHNLVSGVLTKFGLVPALNDLKDKIESTGKLKVQLLINEMGERLSGEKELQLYRIVQELVSNILKHAKAASATIQLNRQNSTLNLIVEDDGIGFDTDKANRKTGMGMQNLQARVDQLNGTLHYDSGKGSGTTVSIDIPIDKV